MGREDAQAITGLQGGRAPPRPIHDFKNPAVARRPVEKFDIEVALPDWQLEPDEEAWFGEPDQGMMVDPDGNPIAPNIPYASPYGPYGPPPPEGGDYAPAPAPAPPPGGETLDQEWLDRAVGRERTAPPPQQPQPRRVMPPPGDMRRSIPPAEPVERRPVLPQP
jgi:penicillin-binding protein 1A